MNPFYSFVVCIYGFYYIKFIELYQYICLDIASENEKYLCVLRQSKETTSTSI